MTADGPQSPATPPSQTPTAEAWLIGAIALAVVCLSISAAPGSTGVFGAALAAFMLAVAVIDRRRQIIPDPLNALASVVGLAAAALRAEISPTEAVLDALLRAVVMFSLFFLFRAAFRKIRGIEGMGLGDVKLAAVAGIWLEWPLLPLAVEIAAVGALGVVLIGRFRGERLDATTRLPFGAYFGPAIWICWLLGVWRGDFGLL